MSFRPAPALFVSQFAAMAGFLAPVPVLPRIAHDLGVSIATAGQLRTLSGLAAGLTALAAGALAHRLGVRRLIGRACWRGRSSGNRPPGSSACRSSVS